MLGVPPDHPKIRSALLVGRYQMLECIGEGGMGVVWRALDLDLEEPVAIKFLRDEFASDDTLRACFRREVKLARRVTHRNVARVFEFGRDGELYFLTMEFIAGESLHTLLESEQNLSPARTMDIALALCHGLAAAHAAGIVHGDIKPANILLEPQRGAVLTDFGVARVLSEAHLTAENAWGGTPLYMAPEQITDEVFTFQADVYAVGVVLLEALTGTFPWPVATLSAMFEVKCSGHDPDLRELTSGLSPPWHDLLSNCLHHDPDRRPANARALLARLEPMQGAAADLYVAPSSSTRASRHALATTDAGAPPADPGDEDPDDNTR